MLRERRVDIELMRIIAAFFVVFNHTGGRGFFLFSHYDSHSFPFWIYLFVSVFCKFSVYLFFMISGALLLCKETISISKLWKDKIIPMAVTLIVWSAIYYLIEVYKGNAELGLGIFALTLYRSDWNYSFWYLYSYIAFLMTVPVLQRIAKALSNKEYMYIFFLVFAFASLRPVGEYFLWQGDYKVNGNFNLNWLTANILLYPLLGYFLYHRVACFWSKKKLCILWLINILLIGLSCYLTYHKSIITGELSEGASQTFHSTFVLVNCTAVFTTCQFFFRNRKVHPFVQNILVSLGGATFGIYLVHVFLNRVFNRIHVLDFLQDTFRMNAMLTIWLYCGCILLTGYLLTMILKRVPLLKKIV